MLDTREPLSCAYSEEEGGGVPGHCPCSGSM